jgi:hypothetical protein
MPGSLTRSTDSHPLNPPLNSPLNYGPSTRSATRPKTPPNQNKGYYADTLKNTWFFDMYDERHPHETIPTIALVEGTSIPTASR